MKIMVEIQCIFLKMPLTHLGWVLRTYCCNPEILHLVSLHIGVAGDHLTTNILKRQFLLCKLTSRHFLISKRETE